MIPENLQYTKEHEWVLLEGSKAKVGITHHAQEQLGDVVYVELPKEGTAVTQMTPCGVIESVKAVSDLFTPLSGKVLSANPVLTEHPEKVNQDPYGEGWMFVLDATHTEESKNLMNAKQYKDWIGSGH